jgi:hypothetical protein
MNIAVGFGPPAGAVARRVKVNALKAVKPVVTSKSANPNPNVTVPLTGIAIASLPSATITVVASQGSVPATSVGPVVSGATTVLNSGVQANPLAASATLTPNAGAAGRQVVTGTTTTTSIPPAAFPAPADPPKRATAGTLEPYRGLGAWVDRYDWTNLFTKDRPAFTLASVDRMAAAGIQTMYIQIPHWQTTPDIYEPERLQPIIDRAHALGMYVVGWYLPWLFDVNTDLRKLVAMANLDLDGIQIDIEKTTSVAMASVTLRNLRLSEFHRSLRLLLPGRMVSADIVAPTLLDGQTSRWAWPSYPAKTTKPNWGGPFPYAEIFANYDLVGLQTHWTVNTSNSGWKDAQAFVLENMNRMRTYSGRAEFPIQAIGGLPNAQSTINDLIGYIDAAKASGSFGFSLYDWETTPSSWWPAMWGLRSVVDPRFPSPALSPYVPLAQPATPPVTTTTTIKQPANAPSSVASTTIPESEVVIK